MIDEVQKALVSLLFDSTFQHVGRKHYDTKFLVWGLALHCTLGIFSACLQCVDRMTDNCADRQIDRQSSDQEMLHNNLLAPVGFVFFSVDWPIPLGSTFWLFSLGRGQLQIKLPIG